MVFVRGDDDARSIYDAKKIMIIRKRLGLTMKRYFCGLYFGGIANTHEFDFGDLGIHLSMTRAKLTHTDHSHTNAFFHRRVF